MSRENRMSDGSSPARNVPVDWEALEDAFENNAQEVHSYLHLESGEVLRVVDGVADPEMHARIISEVNYLRVESVSSREQYRWMERFIQMVEDPALRDLLAQAIDGKGAFRRFKDVLMAHSSERERWFVFRSERLRVFMEAWLAAHAFTAVPRAEQPQADDEMPPSPKATTAVAVEQAAGPEAVAGEIAPVDNEPLRWSVTELLVNLEAPELEQVLTFIRFLKSQSPPAAQAKTAVTQGAAVARDSGCKEESSKTTSEDSDTSARAKSPLVH